jgi:hypothetical protein
MEAFIMVMIKMIVQIGVVAFIMVKIKIIVQGMV